MDARVALQKAVNDGSEESILNLLKAGIDLKNERFGSDLLVIAAKKKNCERIIEHLLEYGAQPTHELLILLCQLNYDEIIVEKLLKHGAEPTVSVTPGYVATNALHELAMRNKSKLCDLLLKYGADVNKGCYGCCTTPLYWAIQNKSNDAIEVLLHYGANPLQESKDAGIPLQYIFGLPVPVIENVIKHASLQVDSDNDENVSKFLAYFRRDKERWCLHFAMKCLGEIETLKQQWLIDHESTLFDFVVSQQKSLDSFLTNTSNVNQVFKLVSTKLLPIYSEVILKKFERITMVNKVLEFSYLKLSVISLGKQVFIDTDIIECICKFLTNKDLRNFFLAFASPQ